MSPRHKAKIETPESLERLKESILAKEQPDSKTVIVCCGTGCLASGGHDVKEALENEIRAQEPDEEIIVKKTGCRGFCENGPIVVVGPEDIFYHRVAREDVPEIVSET